MKENCDNLEFVSSKKLKLNGDIPADGLNMKTSMFLLLSTVLLGNTVNIDFNFNLLKEEFPNMEIVLKYLDMELDG
jgi:hypothetical protein